MWTWIKSPQEDKLQIISEKEIVEDGAQEKVDSVKIFLKEVERTKSKGSIKE